MSSEYDLKKIIKVAKKEFACNGTVVDHSEYGEVLQLQVISSVIKVKSSKSHQLMSDKQVWVTMYYGYIETFLKISKRQKPQGDQRENICKLLVTCGLVKQDQLKVHGF